MSALEVQLDAHGSSKAAVVGSNPTGGATHGSVAEVDLGTGLQLPSMQVRVLSLSQTWT